MKVLPLAVVLLAGMPESGVAGPARVAGSREAGCSPPAPLAVAVDDGHSAVPESEPALMAVWSADASLLLSNGERLVPDGIALPSRLHPFPEVTEAASRAADGVLSGGTLRLGALQADRHGRLVGRALLVGSDGRDSDGAGEDLATALLKAGAGYARWEGPDPCAPTLLAAEDEARRARRGIWALPTATARAADVLDAGARVGLFAVVEGRPTDTGRTRERFFLNFGRRWKNDFTIVLDARESATIFKDGLDPAMMRGTLVRVRGVVRADGGPAVFPRAPLELNVVEPDGLNHFGANSDEAGVTEVQELTEGEAR